MEILVKAAQLIMSLSLLVIIHEFGHFMFAKLFNCRVEKFYLFFDPWFSIFKTQKGETEYGIGWLPLGGYVKISGMIDESMDKEQMAKPAEDWEFRAKPAWQRLLIMVGGVVNNFILALMIYSMTLFVWGEQYLPTDNVKFGIVAGELGQEIGFKSGDKILSVDNHKVENFHKIIPTIVLEEAKTVQVERNGVPFEITISPDHIPALLKSQKSVISLRIPFSYEIAKFAKNSTARDSGMDIGDNIIAINGQKFEYNDQFRNAVVTEKGNKIEVEFERKGAIMTKVVQLDETGYLGVYAADNSSGLFEFETIEYGFFASIPAGINKGISTIGDYLKQLKLLFSPKTKAYESLGGFISIGKIFPGYWNWHSFWNLTAFLSIILAVMNILPIPALDGGHVLFLLFEIISGRKPSDKFLEYAQIVGMVILFSLLIFANGNDIIKLFR